MINRDVRSCRLHDQCFRTFLLSLASAEAKKTKVTRSVPLSMQESAWRPAVFTQRRLPHCAFIRPVGRPRRQSKKELAAQLFAYAALTSRLRELAKNDGGLGTRNERNDSAASFACHRRGSGAAGWVAVPSLRHSSATCMAQAVLR